MAKYFGGKDPFDDPFFTQPFNAFFDWKSQFDGQTSSGKQITIEEINSDGDADHAHKSNEPGQELVVKKPKETSANKGTQSFSFRRVAYGGLNGWYYTYSEGRMTGGDGVFQAEIKEEDKIVGESLHTISKGIQSKGHSVTTKHNSDGRVDTLQTLHNLNEDELPGFEENWKVTADKYLPGWSSGSNLLEDAGAKNVGWDGFPSWSGWGGWPFPSIEYFGNAGAMEPYGQSRDTPNEKSRRIVPVE